MLLQLAKARPQQSGSDFAVGLAVGGGVDYLSARALIWSNCKSVVTGDVSGSVISVLTLSAKTRVTVSAKTSERSRWHAHHSCRPDVLDSGCRSGVLQIRPAGREQLSANGSGRRFSEPPPAFRGLVDTSLRHLSVAQFSIHPAAGLGTPHFCPPCGRFR